MEFLILGPLEVRRDRSPLPLGGSRQRALLGVLLLQPHSPVSSSELIECVWGADPPATAPHMVHVYISRLRMALANGAAADVLLTTHGGYQFAGPVHEIDLSLFQDLGEEGRQALQDDKPELASERLHEALSLWRGSPLSDLPLEGPARGLLASLDNLHLTTLEDRIQADIEIGKHRSLADELPALVSMHPLRESLRSQQMIALYRCGRQAEALEAYRNTRTTLRDELGIDPSPELSRLHERILKQDPRLDWMPEGIPSPLVAPVPHSGNSIGVPSPTYGVGEGDARRNLKGTGERATARRQVRIVTLVAALALLAIVGAVLGDTTLSHPMVHIGPNTVGVIDAGTGSTVAQVRVGMGPSTLAVGAGAVWVSNFGARTVSRIDLASNSETARIGDVGIPSAIAAGEGKLWVADSFDGKITEVDAATARGVGVISAVDAPTGLAVGFGSVWVSDVVHDTVTRLDVSTGAVQSVIRLDPNTAPSALTVGSGSVWVASSLHRSVTRIDPSSDSVVAAAIALCCQPSTIVNGGDVIWVTSQINNKLMKIDPETNQVSLTISAGSQPSALAYGAGDLWLGHLGDGGLWRITQDGEVMDKIEVGSGVSAIAFAQGRLFSAVAG